eukprot:m.75018 g.75018  ORF g.75018 m.75018 type:complete len:443 (-) comp12431_c0_seq1:226-1554(-)
MAADTGEQWLLHRAALEGNVELLEKGLSSDIALGNINGTDKHGNTPLMLAILQSRTDMVQKLLDAGAKVDLKVKWPPLAEAISVGNIDIVRAISKADQRATEESMKKHLATAKQKISDVPDFEMQISWEVVSWVPMVSWALPSDTIVIRKSGTSIRLDTTLRDVTPTTLKRGNLAILVNTDETGNVVLYDINHDTQEYTTASNFFQGCSEQELETAVIQSLVTPQLDVDVLGRDAAPTRDVSFFGLGSPKVEVIGSYTCDVYSLSDLSVVSTVRTEHQCPETKRWWKEAKAAMRGGVPLDAYMEKLPPPMHAIEPAPVAEMSWEEYIAASAKPALGRPREEQVRSKNIKASLWMSDRFPITPQDLLDILGVFEAAHPNIKALKQFLSHNMPPGFPVKVSVPLFPTISALVTFLNYTKDTSHFAPDVFEVPKHYKQTPDTAKS